MNSIIDDLDLTAKELKDQVVRQVREMRGEIKHPAMSVELTQAEQWAKNGQSYLATRDDPEVWRMTLAEFGEEETIKFSRMMEMVMMEEQDAATG